MKRLPKSDVSNTSKAYFVLQWWERNFHTGREFQCEREYSSRDTALKALEAIKSQKSKSSYSLKELKPCPVSPEEEAFMFRESGARWDIKSGMWLYSASY